MEMTKEELAELVSGQVREALGAAVQTVATDAEPTEGAPAFDVLNFLEMEDAGDTVVNEFKKAMLDQYDMMRERASTEAAQMIATIRRESTVTEFAQNVTAGTAETPRGLPVKADELKTWMLSLNPSQLNFAQKMLGDIQASGVIEFRELGHGKILQGQKQVPDFARESLQAAIDAGSTPKEFFELAEMGDSSEYDLSDFTEVK